MTEEIKRRLTSNQRLLLTQAMKRYDHILIDLIRKAKEVDSISSPSERLSQNSDFKKKALACHDRFSEYLEKKNIVLPIFFEASKKGSIEKTDKIVR